MKWMRYVCCAFAIIAIVIVVYQGTTEPGQVALVDHEPAAKRFDHITFTNGSDTPVTNLMFAIDDHLGNPYLPDTDHTVTVQPGATVSFVFNHEPSVAAREVRMRATWMEGEPLAEVEKNCTIMVSAEWNITSARFWLGTPGVGGGPTSVRSLSGDATVCHKDGGSWHVIPHESSDP